MKRKPVFIFFISLLLSICGFAQEQKPQEKAATTPTQASQKHYQHYGLRIGADISKLVRTFTDKNYEGLELVGDYRLNDRYYIAGEIGKEYKNSTTNYFDFATRGEYIKLGFDYNSYTNWYGMENMIYFGARYGFSSFSQEVSRYNLHTLYNIYWNESLSGSESDLLTTYHGRTAHWLEGILGIKVELFKHFYAGASVRFSLLLYNKKSDQFPNFWIPGIQRVWEGSSFGINYNYTLTYMIPLFKK